ncbi:hypothetical protein [Cecembia lonarensis]|uniref:Uncharacterized protein n=1 Tax=Cecembia lonarensis (strain CCUG 58316 / KCTC 22772 / LW9) TaxID=1225176 RepID=K1M3Z5_CECL9|nr:hypothetical protein [Cecembia lonarensis]EKB50974.1 hypothetical protein B879_00261 [Cecembia lonarensis LW9]
MELTMNIKFEQLVEIVKQLPDEMKSKLFESVIQKKKTKLSKEDFQKFLLHAPTWSGEQIEASQNARKHINLSRIA